MTPEQLREILARVASGALDPQAALDAIKHLPFDDLGFARVDHHRQLRVGFPEVIFGQGKTAEQIVAIAGRLLGAGQNLLVTRLVADVAATVVERMPEIDYDPVSRTARRIVAPRTEPARGTVLVVAAGTTDIPVAEEAVRTLEVFGDPVDRLYDVGVSGLHRLLASKDKLTTASALIVVAGMEGALPSVVAGLVDRPVVGVPTSIGYGAALGGMTALLSMLNSCAAGLTVVNIDNGFGAAVAASLINRR